MIKAHFGAIPAAASPRPRPIYDVPDHPGTRYTIATDPEATATTVSVSTHDGARDQTTLGAYRQQTIERTFRRPALRPARGDRAEAGRAVPGRADQPRRSSCSPPRPRR